ncbi:uncharacterized protein LOC106138558 [Amyelois transitella]|uniref:uncharacterized protein LOC106138558 n=1 Tax=Amyelois transitella TaxID=680683 RepID=UPI0029902450|nr:uncharacterized protein LOC106138558 [Amyelois transitella]
MDTTTSMKPKTMAELLPGLSGILSKEALQTLTARKQPRKTLIQTRTAEKVLKPLTLAEMRADILALKVKSPRRCPQSTASAKKNWNSSVKVDKKISHTADGQMKNNPVRKALNFQPKTKSVVNSRATIHQATTETPRFPKPEFRAKKSIMQARNVRISGICNIPETPVINKPVRSRMTLANKENISNQSNVIKKPFVPQRQINHKKLMPPILDTPLSNESWKSSCDASFLQKEKEINDVEIKAAAVSDERTLENIAEVTPPVSTPFKEYRNVQEYFNNSSELESSAMYNDNTIMCFDKPKPENQRDESVIVSLCELLNKATVTNNEKPSTELQDLIEVERQTENNIKMIENGIKTLNNIKESQIKSLKYVRKLINEKKNCRTESKGDKDKTLVDETETISNDKIPIIIQSPEKSHMRGEPCSVIRSCAKSPSYKIPKKNLCLRKKVFCKSMPNVSSQSPNRDIEGRALNMYMKMKEQMNFLNTPLVKHHRKSFVPDTPSVITTSNNLQRQLDKLYCGS